MKISKDEFFKTLDKKLLRSFAYGINENLHDFFSHECTQLICLRFVKNATKQSAIFIYIESTQEACIARYTEGS